MFVSHILSKSIWNLVFPCLNRKESNMATAYLICIPFGRKKIFRGVYRSVLTPMLSVLLIIHPPCLHCGLSSKNVSSCPVLLSLSTRIYQVSHSWLNRYSSVNSTSLQLHCSQSWCSAVEILIMQCAEVKEINKIGLRAYRQLILDCLTWYTSLCLQKI